MLLRSDIMPKLLNQNGLADTGTTEQTDFSAFDIRTEKVDDLDSSFINLRFRGLILEFRRIIVDGMRFLCGESRSIINGLT